jgi:hypothetical protein
MAGFGMLAGWTKALEKELSELVHRLCNNLQALPLWSLPQVSKGWWSKSKAILTGLGAVGAALGLPLAIKDFWPQISVEPTAAADPSNPFSGIYKITNEQGYPLTDVSVETSLRCAKIGRGSDTSPPGKCEPSMHTSRPLWTNHTLEPHEPYEITPGDLLIVTPPTALLYAQISIFVSYWPWKLPIPLRTMEFRFQSRRLSARSNGCTFRRNEGSRRCRCEWRSVAPPRTFNSVVVSPH